MAAGNLHERENFRVFTLYFLINNDLFTYEIEVPKPTLCDEQQTSNPTHNDIEEYKWKMSYEECEKIYVEVVIFVNKRLVRLVDVIVEQWLDLKYGNHKTMDENVNKGEREEQHKKRGNLFDDTTRNLPIYEIRRFEMIKYSFGQEEEYVDIKEYEYDYLTRTNDDPCHAYREIFHNMDEGWLVTRAE
ncbi:hypothetical protein Tco_0217487 [Tanacetum coccineum]